MPPTTSSDLPLSINGQGKHLADRFAVLQLVFVALWFTIGVSFALQAAPHPAWT